MKTRVAKPQKRKSRKSIRKLLGSKRLIISAGILLLLMIAAFGMHGLLNGWSGNISDTDRANDLAHIETGIIGSLQLNHHLPASLTDLHIAHLKGKVSDYAYSAEPYEEGSPTQSYTICATFQTQTIKLPIEDDSEYTTGGMSVEAYKAHRKGKQCFSNGFYKDASHIGLIYNKGEIIAPKVELNDARVSDFISETNAYYDAQRAALGSVGFSSSDLQKDCLKAVPQQNGLYDDPFGNLYACKIFYDSSVSISGDQSHITTLVDTFVSTAKNEGFLVTDTTYPASSADSLAYRWVEGTGGGQFGCRSELTYYMKAPQTSLQYRYACGIGNLKNLPAGFRVVKEFTGP